MGALLTSFATWLIAVLLYIPQKIWELLLDGLSAMLAAIPAPGFITGLQGALNTIAGDVLFWLGIFNAGYGISVVFAAWCLRWLTRRIPLVG